MSSGHDDDTLGTYTQWASGFSDASLERALTDQRALQRGQLNGEDDTNRTTPAGKSRRDYDIIRSDRDDLDYREWNTESAFSGVNRWPDGPGVQSQGQRRRRARRLLIDDGF